MKDFFFFPSNRFIHRHTDTWDKRLNVEIHHYQEESIRRTRHAVWGTLVILEILRQKNVAKFGWILLLSLFLEIDYFSSLDGSVISLRHWASRQPMGRELDKESPAFPFDGSSVSIASRNCVKALIKQLVCWAVRAILGSSFSSGNSC